MARGTSDETKPIISSGSSDADVSNSTSSYSTSYTLTSESGPPCYTVDQAYEQIGMGRYQYKRFPILAMVGFSQAIGLTLPYMLMVAFICVFKLSVFEQSLTMAMLFLGNIAGDIAAGVICDRAGRKIVILMGTWILFIGIASLMFTFWYISLLWRTFAIGVGIGLCTFTTIIMISEFCTISSRGIYISLIYVFWGAGTLYTTVVAFLVMNGLGWKVVVMLCAVPVFITAILVYFVPETPKFLCTSGNLDSAMTVLSTMAKENKQQLPEGVLVAQSIEERGQISEMFDKDYRKVSVLLMIVYFSTGFVFYSTYAMLPFLLQDGYCGVKVAKGAAKCVFSSTTLRDTMLVTAGEVIMIPIVAVASEQFGRLPTMRVISTIMACSSTLLLFCFGILLFLLSLFLQRGSVQGLFNVLYVYAPESFPTHIRAAACGVIMSMMTAGGLLSAVTVYPIGVQYSWKLFLSMLVAASVVSAIITYLLSNETKGTNLPDVQDIGICTPCRYCKCKKTGEEEEDN